MQIQSKCNSNIHLTGVWARLACLVKIISSAEMGSVQVIVNLSTEAVGSGLFASGIIPNTEGLQEQFQQAGCSGTRRYRGDAWPYSLSQPHGSISEKLPTGQHSPHHPPVLKTGGRGGELIEAHWHWTLAELRISSKKDTDIRMKVSSKILTCAVLSCQLLT